MSVIGVFENYNNAFARSCSCMKTDKEIVEDGGVEQLNNPSLQF